MCRPHFLKLISVQCVIRPCRPQINSRACTANTSNRHYIVDIKLQRPSVCLYRRHDRRTATKFGTHIRVPRYGTHSQLKKIDPGAPTQGGGVLGGQKIKSPGNVMNCPENQEKTQAGKEGPERSRVTS